MVAGDDGEVDDDIVIRGAAHCDDLVKHIARGGNRPVSIRMRDSVPWKWNVGGQLDCLPPGYGNGLKRRQLDSIHKGSIRGVQVNENEAALGLRKPAVHARYDRVRDGEIAGRSAAN
jgi:hypothetical protein